MPRASIPYGGRRLVRVADLPYESRHIQMFSAISLHYRASMEICS
jgi:hypothetical protein